jgi:hypothetical protein
VGLSPPPSEERRSEPTDFLRNRRGQLTPQAAGLPANGPRRTPEEAGEQLRAWWPRHEVPADQEPACGLARLVGKGAGGR